MKGRELVKDAIAYCEAKGLKDPAKAYAAQRNNAREREIGWEITFDEWWGIWKDYFHLRGRGTNDLCMARNGDQGPYKVGNVYLTTKLGNSADYHDPRNAEKRAKQDREAMYWGKNRKNTERISHLAFKIHCNPKKFVAQ